MSAFAGLVSAAALFLLSRFGRGWLPLDRPNGRSLHRHPTPRIGGLGVLSGIAAAFWLAPPTGALLWLAAIAGLLGLVSLMDDIRGLPVLLRLLVHFTAAALAALAVLRFENPAWAAASTIALVWMANLFNFMDGADGMAGGMAVAGFGCYGLAACWVGAYPVAAMTWSVAAAAGGFLLFNFHPARLFLGDCGSIPIGFAAGAIGLLGWQQGVWPVWFPAAVFAPFIFDATATLLRRAARGERFWESHSEHYYQRAIRMGLGHRRTILLWYGLMLFSGGVALSVRQAGPGMQLIGLAGISAVLAAAMLLLDRRWAAFHAGHGKA